MSSADDNRTADLEHRFREAVRLYEARRFDAAEQIILDILGQASGHAPSYNLRGGIWMARGDGERAALNFVRSVRLDDRNPGYRSNLAQALFRAGRVEDALESFEIAVELAPDEASIRGNYASSLRDLNRATEAASHLRHALLSDPDDPQLLGSLGNCLTDLDEFAEAETVYRSAVALNPDHAGAAYNLALFLLRAGILDEGLKYYESRWQLPGWRRRPFFAKMWSGELSDLEGKRILVWGEQGLGDEILFSGNLQALVNAGAQVTLECEARLVPLMQRSWPEISIYPALDPVGTELQGQHFDLQTPIGSLPYLLGVTSSREFGRHPPRLVPDTGLTDRLRRNYQQGEDALLVGISWRSGASTIASRKSAALDLWGEVLGLPGIRVVDLQYGDTTAERSAFEQKTGIRLLHDPQVDSSHDLDAFAAQVAAVDHVITISNATAHFAGALGVPADLLLSNGALWHWFSGMADSPHYPSLKLHRQETPGDWSILLSRIAGRMKTARAD